MNWNTIKGYIYVVASGLFLLAAAILVFSNLGVYCKSLTFFWTQLEHQSVAVLMLVSAAMGIVTYWMVKLFIKGAMDIWRGRKEARIGRLGRMEKDMKAQNQQKKEAAE
ncbi:MAG: hypothetical protein K8S55_11090 [Phycisphaerae bacterium]|nr:hypothetical protein [Phycisphaerae bacterium]